MISIVLAIILGVGFTLVAVQNPVQVPITLFETVFSLPLYIFAAFSFLAGILVTLIFQLFDSTSQAIDLHARDIKIREANKINANLQTHTQKLVTENTKLRKEVAILQSKLRGERVESAKQNVKTFFGKVKHSFS